MLGLILYGLVAVIPVLIAYNIWGEDSIIIALAISFMIAVGIVNSFFENNVHNIYAKKQNKKNLSTDELEKAVNSEPDMSGMYIAYFVILIIMAIITIIFLPEIKTHIWIAYLFAGILIFLDLCLAMVCLNVSKSFKDAVSLCLYQETRIIGKVVSGILTFYVIMAFFAIGVLLTIIYIVALFDIFD